MRTTLTLEIRVFAEEGMYIAECQRLGWSTHGRTLDELLADVPRMVRDWFDGHRRVGALASALARLGIASPAPDVLGIDLQIDLRAVEQSLRAEQHVDVSLAA